MSEHPESRSVQLTRVFDAPIDLVYQAWTDPAHVMKWMKCHPDATMEVEGWEPRAGAMFRYRMAKVGEFEALSTGRILEADPPNVFVYATDPNPALGAPELTVRVELEPVDEKTKLTLTHSGLPNEGFCGIVEGGWTVSLGLLQDLVLTLATTFTSAYLMKTPESKEGNQE